MKQIDKNEYSYSDSDDSDTLFVGTLYKDKDQSDSWCENITVGNTSIKFQLDTSAKCNVLNRSDFGSI